MGALPKRKYAKARQRKRRSHLGIIDPPLINCSQCGTPKISHHVCPTCGSYAGKEIIEIKQPKKKAG